MSKTKLLPEHLAQARAEGYKGSSLNESPVAVAERPVARRATPIPPQAPPSPWREHMVVLIGTGVVTLGVLVAMAIALFSGSDAPEEPSVARPTATAPQQAETAPEPQVAAPEPEQTPKQKTVPKATPSRVAPGPSRWTGRTEVIHFVPERPDPPAAELIGKR